MSSARTRDVKRSDQENSARDQALQPIDDMVNWVRTSIRQDPEVAACVCLGIGFILGWRLKPW